MELAQLMQHLSTGDGLPHYMIWYGEEQKIIDMYLDRIKSFYKPVHCESVAFVVNQLRVKSLDKSNKVYIVTEDDEYRKNEQAWNNVKEMLNKSKHILLLRYASVNKKLKFYTQQKESFTEFVHLQPDILTSYIQKDIDLSDSNCEKLISMCGNDYGRILLEMDKIWQLRSSKFSHLEKGGDIIEADTAFDILIKQGAIYSEIGDITFELTNAVLGGYPDKAIQKLDEAKRKGEPTLRIISILYDGFRNLVSYNALGKDKKDAGKRTGLTGWQIKQCIDLNGGYSMKELIRNMMLCQKAESGIKQGTIEEEIALEYVILGCLK